MNWQVGFLDQSVFGELESQPRDIRAAFERIASLIESVGL
jgi:hypothetical protein